MRGLFGSRNFQTELRPRPERPLGMNEVVVRVDACGVCGTDLHFLRQMTEPTPMGHEIAGTIQEVGSGVRDLCPGQKVIVEDIAVCGHCEFCKTGRVGLCTSGVTLDGQPGMSDFLQVDALLCDVYHDMPLLRAAMVEPTATAIRCVETLSPPPFGSLAVFGMGAIGLLCAAVARLFGTTRIVSIANRHMTGVKRKSETLFDDFGIDEGFYTQESDCYESIARRHGQFDSVLVAAPPRLVNQALSLLKPGGRVLVAGVTFGGDSGVCPIDFTRLVFEKKSILTSLAEPAVGFPTAIRLLEEGRIPAEKLVTHTFALEEHTKLAQWFQSEERPLKAALVGNA